MGRSTGCQLGAHLCRRSGHHWGGGTGGNLRYQYVCGIGEVFLALSVLQTPVTAAVNHASLHGFEQLRLCVGVWPTCPNRSINVIRQKDLVSVFEKDQDMHMGQTAFLKLNCVHIGDSLSKDPILVKFLDDGLLLHVENPHAEIWSIRSCLPREQLPRDLQPGWVTGDGNEEVDALVVTGKRKRILKALLHISGTTSV